MLSYQNRRILFQFFNGDFTCEEVVKSLYDLNHLEFEIYCTLLHFKEADQQKIANFLEKKEQTTINRSLRALMSRGLCKREIESKNGKRGFQYLYSPKSLKRLKSELTVKINYWCELALIEVKYIDKHFNQKTNKNQDETH